MKLTIEGSDTRTERCACGKLHRADLHDVFIGSGVLSELPALVRKYGSKPFIVDDINTRAAAGDRVRALLDMPFSAHTFRAAHTEPNEAAVGSAFLHFDHSCDVIVAVGSGVIGDISKILARTAKLPLITVATAPSMDGFASATSSMCRDGLKISIDSTCPVAIIGDTDILCKAPARMIASGVGDMAAKYISLCEWQLAHVINGEYYCPDVADAMREALDTIAANVDGLACREPSAIEAVMRGLVLAGVAMTWAGVSRPASGTEHYFSHVWDMRTEEFGTPGDLHGIQCGIGTLLSLKLYEFLSTLTPDREKALAHAASFDPAAHNDYLRRLLGRAAESMIELEKREKKYDPDLHRARLARILENWDELRRIIAALPTYAEVEALLTKVGAPTTAAEIGVSDTVADAARITCDIRDKYIGTRILWDLGVLEEAIATL